MCYIKNTLKLKHPIYFCSRIEKQNEQPATSGEPISLHRLKRQRVACCICRQNSGHKFGFIWLPRLTNARGHLCKFSNHPWLHKNRWQVSGAKRWNVTTKPHRVNSICGNTRMKEEESDEKWQVNLFLLSYFMDSIGLDFWFLSFLVDFYLTISLLLFIIK